MRGPQAITRLFPDLATVSKPSAVTQDAEGAEQITTTPIYTDIRAQFSPLDSSDTEVRTGSGEFVSATHRVGLNGDFPDIDETCEVTLRGRTFDVVSVQRDSFSIITTLHAQERRP